MKLGIMQPYFLPYLGYFTILKNTDEFILLDTVQFMHHGWIERNRILKPGEGVQYFSVPLVKHSQDTKIIDIKISNDFDWREKILAQLEHYKKKAPYYEETIQVMKKILDIRTDSIVELNKHAMEEICEYLGIKADIKIFSEMNLNIDKVNAPDEWALNICKVLENMDEYWNPPGGKDFFDKSKYDNAGIKLKFVQNRLRFYSQRRGIENFEPGLSIIDVMMFNSKEEINNMLDDYYFI